MSKQDKIAKLKEYIKNYVIKELEKDDEIEEVSTTASAGAANPMGTGIYYDTPKAFSSGSAVGHKSPEVGGYKKVNEAFVSSGKVSDVFLKLKSKGFGNKKFGDISKELSKHYKTPGLADVLASMFKEIWMKGNKKEAEKEVLDWLKTVAKKTKLESIKEVTKQEVSGLTNLHTGLEKLQKDYFKVSKMGDKELRDRKYNKHYETILTAKKEIGKLLQILKNKEMLGEGRYHDWRNDESMTPKQKVGRSMREIRDALNELDKTVKMNLKLKTELNMNSKDYWKNTHKALTKISERLVKMANKIGNLK